MKFIVTGPECSGKTNLSEYLSSEFKYPLIPEYARKYIAELGRSYVKEDLDRIARQQMIEWNQNHAQAVIFDTDILTTIIWHEEKYGSVPNFMLEHWLSQKSTFYLLCKPDIPWKSDPLRENPDDRDRLFQIYFHYLNAYGRPFKIVSGKMKERNNPIREFVSRLTGNW